MELGHAILLVISGGKGFYSVCVHAHVLGPCCVPWDD